MIEDAVAVAAPPATAGVCQLEHLNFPAGFSTCLATSPLLMEVTALSHLGLFCLRSDPIHAPHGDVLKFFRGLSLLPLRSLNLEMGDFHGFLPGLGTVLAGGLTRLTALRVWAWACTPLSLQTPADIYSLSRITGLRKLHLASEGVEERLHMHVSCMRALHTLHALTSLVCNLEQGFSNSVLCAAPPHAWPALQQLGVQLSHPHDTTTVFRFAGSRPALTWLCIGRDLPHQGDEQRHADVWTRIKTEAAEAGITVSFDLQLPF